MLQSFLYLFLIITTQVISACSEPIERPPLALSVQKEYWVTAGSQKTITPEIEGLGDEEPALLWQTTEGLSTSDTSSKTLTITAPTVNECEVRTFGLTLQVKTPTRYEYSTSLIHVADKECTIGDDRLTKRGAQYSLVTVNEINNLGEVWIGTQDQGLLRIFDNNKVDWFNSNARNINQNRILAIKPQGSRVWIATPTYIERAHLTDPKIFAPTARQVDKVDQWGFDPASAPDDSRYISDFYISEQDSKLIVIDGGGSLHEANLSETDKDSLKNNQFRSLGETKTTEITKKKPIPNNSTNILLHQEHLYLFSETSMNIYPKEFNEELHTTNLPVLGSAIKHVLSFENYIYMCSEQKFVRITSLPKGNTFYENVIDKSPTEIRRAVPNLKSAPTFNSIAASEEHVFLATNQGIFAFSADESDIELTEAKRFYNSDDADYKILDDDIVSIAYEKNLKRLWILSRTKGLMGIIIPLVLPND